VGSADCRCGRRHLGVVVHQISQASSTRRFVREFLSEMLPRPALHRQVTRQRGHSGQGPKTCAPLAGIQAVAHGSFKLCKIQLTAASGTLRGRARKSNPRPVGRADSRRTRTRTPSSLASAYTYVFSITQGKERQDGEKETEKARARVSKRQERQRERA
jgi:hypothetical protein